MARHASGCSSCPLGEQPSFVAEAESAFNPTSSNSSKACLRDGGNIMFSLLETGDHKETQTRLLDKPRAPIVSLALPRSALAIATCGLRTGCRSWRFGAGFLSERPRA